MLLLYYIENELNVLIVQYIDNYDSDDVKYCRSDCLDVNFWGIKKKTTFFVSSKFLMTQILGGEYIYVYGGWHIYPIFAFYFLLRSETKGNRIRFAQFSLRFTKIKHNFFVSLPFFASFRFIRIVFSLRFSSFFSIVFSFRFN